MGDGFTEQIDPHAFDDQLGGDVRALIDHDTRLVLGRTCAGTLTLRVDEHGLWGSIAVNEGDQDALNLYARVQRGDVSQCSIGFDITEEEQIQRGNGWHFTIRRLTLYEVSVVTFPAYEDTGVEARGRSVKAMRRRTLEQWKKDMKGRIHHGTQNDSEQA